MASKYFSIVLSISSNLFKSWKYDDRRHLENSLEIIQNNNKNSVDSRRDADVRKNNV